MHLKPKEKVIYDMCITYRHDYSLHKEEFSKDYLDGCSGTTEQERKIIYSQMSSLYDHHIAPLRKIIEDTLKALPASYTPSHTPDSIPEQVRYYVKEYARMSHDIDKLVDLHKPYCKQCKTNLVYYDGWNCECEGPDVWKNWNFENSEGLSFNS
jgi:hypothetical protein